MWCSKPFARDKYGVLLSEYDLGVARQHANRLAEGGFDVVTVTSAESMANAFASSKRLDVAIVDFDLPRLDGLAALARIRRQSANVFTIVTTSRGSLTSAVETVRAGAFDYLIKPFSGDRLVEAVQAAVGAKGGERLAQRPPQKPPQGHVRMLGSSRAVSRVSQIIRKAASSRAAVFITGESGTGKEVCAEMIHRCSERVGKPFVAFNCSNLPRELVESEIFGHVKGAFTGASADRRGAAMMADGGTFFLDEICEMDLSLQAKLLRLFQNGRVRRLGATSEEEVDVRIICATNRDPRNEVLAGRFREDLYYRLHVIPIEMPPLRERDNDAVELARVFVAEYAALEKQMDMRLSPCAESAIAGYTWPGNVRQLQNVLRSAVVLNDTEVLTAEAFPELTSPRLALAANVIAENRPEIPVMQIHRDLSLGRTRSLAEFERYAIERSMRFHNNNVARAAAALNISPSTIYRKLQAWNKTADTLA